MADSIRVVTFQAGGQITELFKIQDDLGLTVNNAALTRDSLSISRGDRNQQMVARGGRYGGEYFGGERLGNSTYAAQILLAGATADLLLAKMSALLSMTEKLPGTHYIEHKNDGATYPSYYEVRAPAKTQDDRSWAQQKGAGTVTVNIEWPVAPLACGAPMDVTNEDVSAYLGDYTFDSSVSADWGVAGAGANLGTERRLVHTIRGYSYGSQQVTVKATAFASPTGFKLGGAKRISANTYVEAYVDDNGANSRLRIDTITGGTRTNRFTTNLAARMSASNVWVRFRIENSVVYAEHFTSAPTPMGTPTTSGSYTLLGADATASGAGVAGQGMLVFTPVNAASTFAGLSIRPYTYRNKTLPDNWSTDCPIPGTANAIGGFQIGTTGGATAPVFGLLGWIGRDNPASAPGPFGVYESTAGSGFATQADANARSGSYFGRAAYTDGDYIDFQNIDLTRVFADPDSPNAMNVEIWARIYNSAANGTIALAASIALQTGAGSPRRYTLEYGTTGKSIAPPSAGSAYRFVKLGTIRLDKPTDATTGLASIRIACVSHTGGATGAFGFDYTIVAASARRAVSPSGKANNTAYPAFTRVTSEVLRTIGRDLSGQFSTGLDGGSPDVGLGGSLIEFPPGKLDMCVKLSSMVPDDPTSNTTSEQLSHSATIHPIIVPQYLHQRDQ